MSRKLLLATASLVAATLSQATTAHACRKEPASGVAGQVVSSKLSLEQGKACFFRHFQTKSDAIGNRSIPATSLSIISKPSVGTASISGNRVMYKARPGRGSDSFVYRSMLNGKPYDYRVNVEIY